MKAKSLLILLFIVFHGGIVCGQGFKPPEEGKAVVYFVRVSNYGFAVSFEFFNYNKYIGAFKGVSYMRYECNPGEQLFWASSENKEFMTSDLKPGGTYIVVVDVIMGFWKAHVGLSPLSIDDEALFYRAKELIMSKAPVEITDKQIEKMNAKLSEFIPEMLDRYEKEWKQEHNFKYIDAEMAIPEESMR
jgi:hypothetical protein